MCWAIPEPVGRVDHRAPGRSPGRSHETGGPASTAVTIRPAPSALAGREQAAPVCWLSSTGQPQGPAPREASVARSFGAAENESVNAYQGALAVDRARRVPGLMAASV